MKLKKIIFDIPELELENFSTYSTKELMAITEMNKIEDMEIDISTVEGLKNMKVHNIMKRPLELSDFMRNFPAENGQKRIKGTLNRKNAAKSEWRNQVLCWNRKDGGV